MIDDLKNLLIFLWLVFSFLWVTFGAPAMVNALGVH